VVESGFRRVLWGVLVVVVDVNLNGFDVFVDLVGWLMVVSGLGILRVLHPAFAKARAWAIVLALLSVLDLGWLETQYVVRQSGNVTYSWDRLWPVRVLQLLGGLAVGWLVCRGVAGRAMEQALPELARRARSVGGWIVLAHVLGGVAMAFAWQSPRNAKIALVIIPVGLFVGLLFLLLLRRAGRELSAPAPEGRVDSMVRDIDADREEGGRP